MRTDVSNPVHHVVILCALLLLASPFTLLSQPHSAESIWLPITGYDHLEGTSRLRITVDGNLTIPVGETLTVWTREEGEGYGGEVVAIEHPDTTRTTFVVTLDFISETDPELLVLHQSVDTTGWHPLRRAAATGMYFGPGIGRSLSGVDVLEGVRNLRPVIVELLDALHATGASIRDDSTTDPELHEPIAFGNMTGVSLVEGLIRADSASLIRCVEYLMADPSNFRGSSVGIVQAYAWWTAFGGPVSPDQILKRLFGARDRAAREEIMDEHRDDIIEYGYLDRWITRAEAVGIAGDIPGGWQLLEIALEGAERYSSSGDIGWGHFVAGGLYERSDSLPEAYARYLRSIESFNVAVDGPVGLSYSLNNAGSVAYRLGRFDESLRHYDRAVELKQRHADSVGEQTSLSSLAATYNSRGWTLEELGEADRAIADFSVAASIYRDLGDPGTAAYGYHRIGSILTAQGNPAEARRWLDTGRALYVEADDLEGQADILDAVAYSFSVEGRHAEAIEKNRIAHEMHLETAEIDDAGFSMANIGQSWWSLGDFYEAEKAHREAILLRQDAGNVIGEAYSWKKLAGMLLDNGDPVRANDALTRATELYESVGAADDLAELAIIRGDLLTRSGTVRSAVDAYMRAFNHYRERGQPQAAADILVTIGDLHLGAKDYRAASSSYGEARRMMIEAEEPAAAFRATTGLGLVAWNEGRAEEAVEWLDEARGLAEESGNPADIAWTLRNIGQIDLSRGRTADARGAFLQVRAIYDSIDDPDGQIDVRLNLGYLATEAGDFAQAMEAFTDARRIAESEGRRGRIADILTATAGLHMLLGQFSDALAADSLSLSMASAADNPWGIAGAHIGLGNTWNTMGEFRRASDSYRVADSIYRSLGDTLSRGTPLNNLGTIWFFQGDFERALEHFTSVLSILRRHGVYTEFLAIVVSNIGEVYYEQRRYADADEWLVAAEEIADSVGARRILASALTIRTKTLREQGELDRAESIGLRAQVISDDIGEAEQMAEIRSVLGDLFLRQDKREEAERTLLESVRYARSIGSYRYLWHPLYSLATIEHARDDRPKAIAYLKEAVDAIEHMRDRIAGGEETVKLFSADRRRIRVYETLVGLLIEEGDVETALGYLERSSNEDLRSRLGPSVSAGSSETREAIATGRRMKATVDLLTERIAAEQALKGGEDDKVAGLRDVRSIAESEYIGFVSSTIEKDPSLRNFFSSGVNPIELRSRKKKIPDGTAVLSYLLGEESLFTFVATRDTVVARVIPVARREVARLVQELYATASLHPDAPERIDADARIARASNLLWSWLIEPVEDQIRGKQRLAIIPSGELGFLPFELIGREGKERLADEFSTFYISDLGIFLHDNPREPNEHVAAFANADGSLPYSEVEAKNIVDLFPGSFYLAGSEATESQAKNVPDGYTTLHFATHGTLDYRDVENSWLSLSPDEGSGEDGRLTLAEIWGITNLADCRLVTLSACNTALGEDLVEGWPINPANAFLQVGVPSVVATLWRVDDRATATFMLEFYRQLPKVGAADALTLARRLLVKSPEYGDPYYWAPFVLLGDWR